MNDEKIIGDWNVDILLGERQRIGNKTHQDYTTIEDFYQAIKKRLLEEGFIQAVDSVEPPFERIPPPEGE